MAKVSIKDPTIRLKPSDQLCIFIASLTHQSKMPENLLKIYQIYSGDVTTTKSIDRQILSKPQFTKGELDTLRKLNRNEIGQDVNAHLGNLIDAENDTEDDSDTDKDNIEQLDAKALSKSQAKILKEKQKQRIKSRLTVDLNDLKWLNALLTEKRQQNADYQVYLHELMEDSKLLLPKNEIKERDPVLEARCVRLRLEQDARVYNAMTKNVDSRRKQLPEDTIAYQMKQINKQLIAVLQFVFSVAAGFAFGFIGVELLIGDLDFGFRLLLGIICSLVIALAEIYFLAKKLNEDYDLSVEPVELKPTVNGTTDSGSTTGSRGKTSPIVAKSVVGGKEHTE